MSDKARVAIYARISTKDKQDVENQLRDPYFCHGFKPIENTPNLYQLSNS